MSKNLFDEYGHPVRVIVDPANPSQLFDDYGRPYIAIEDPSGISLVNHRYEYTLVSSFYNRNKVGSGGGWNAFAMSDISTGATTGSSSTMDSMLRLLPRPGKLGSAFDFDKAFMMSGKFLVSKDSQYTSARILFKRTTSLGDLAAKGLGLEVKAGALYAKSYGVSLKTTDLSMALTVWVIYAFLIVHTPGESIRFYIDSGSGWVLKYTETDTDKMPSGVASEVMYCYGDVENSAGTDNMELQVGQCHLAVAVPKA